MKLWFHRWWPAVLGVGLLGAALIAREPRELGAWFGAPELANDATIAKAVNRAVAVGLNRADVFLNDYGFAGFGVYDLDKVRGLVRALQAAGIRCSLTTWARPSVDWCNGIRDVVGPLANELGCDITFDLEEPWTVALKNASGLDVQTWTDRLFAVRDTAPHADLAVTCIVYGNLHVLSAALNACDTIIPQAYATFTNTSGMKPGELERIAVRRYEGFGKRIVMGAAAWNLLGAYGTRTPREAIAASARATWALPVAGVRYWRIGWLYGEVAEAIRRGHTA